MRIPAARWLTTGVLLLGSLGSLSTCLTATGEVRAQWRPDPWPDAEASTIQAVAHRIECANGYTGPLERVTVVEDEGSVVVAVYVAPLPAGNATCPGNEEVPLTLDLDEPLGDRVLLNGDCPADASSPEDCTATEPAERLDP